MLDLYMEKPQLMSLIDYIDSIYLKFGATQTVYGDDNKEAVRKIQKDAASADLSLIPARIRHLGTDKCFEILTLMRDHLKEKCTIRTSDCVAEILVEDGRYVGVETTRGEKIYSKYLIAAPGREGSEWFTTQAGRLGLDMITNPVDIGVRVEVPAVVMEQITDVVYESKLVYYTKSFDDRVRTFCMNPYGVVVAENNAGLITVNGHSNAEKTSENTNFAILVSKSFTEPFKEPITYGKSIAKLANLLSGGVIVQRLGDLEGRSSVHRRTDWAWLGHADNEGCDAWRFEPGASISAPDGDRGDAGGAGQGGARCRFTPYAAVRRGSQVLLVPSAAFQRTGNADPQLLAIGDGAGVTRGLAQASVSGVGVAQEIKQREKCCEGEAK